MPVEELKKLVGKRVRHTTLGAYGEVTQVREIYGELIVEVMWDNCARTRFTPKQYAEHVELSPLRKSM